MYALTTTLPSSLLDSDNDGSIGILTGEGKGLTSGCLEVNHWQKRQIVSLVLHSGRTVSRGVLFI